MGNNLLVYTSEPTVRECEIFGQPRIKLYAATSAAYADFTAKIVRVTANGASGIPVRLGLRAVRGCFAMGIIRRIKFTAWEFTLEPVAFVLAAGERLRLEIASSAFPLYDRNPSTGVLPQNADHWNWARSTQQVLHSFAHPSALYLPITGEPAW